MKHTHNLDISRKKKSCSLQGKSRGCLFIPPKRARGGGRSIPGRYRWCYSGYLFLNPSAADIPPIGEGMVGVPSIFFPHSSHSCSHKGGFILQQLGPPLHKTNCNTISPSAPGPIYEAPGRPSNQFPNFKVKFLRCLIWFVLHRRASPRLAFKPSQLSRWILSWGHLSAQQIPFTPLLDDWKDAIRAVLHSCPCCFYDNWMAGAPRTERTLALWQQRGREHAKLTPRLQTLVTQSVLVFVVRVIISSL